MNREKTDKLVHPLIHAPVELGKRLKVVADFDLLLNGFFQQALGDHKLDICARNADLFEAILDPAQAIRHKRKARAVEDGLLDAGDKAKAQIFTNFTDLAQEVQVQD
jgi:hypothetical protein